MPPVTARRLLPLAAGLAVLIALVGGLVLGQGMARGVERVDDPVDLGFARDMKTHHAQAVEMSAIAHRRSPDPQLTYLAFDILTTQQGQIGIMTGWLDLWRQHQTSSGPAMAWMGQAHDGPMPGMATDEQVAALDSLPVTQMEEQFLRLMIRHHRGAVAMAGHAAVAASSSDVRTLARNMELGQAAEIELMQSMLAARGHEPEPDDGAAGHGGHSAPLPSLPALEPPARRHAEQ